MTTECYSSTPHRVWMIRRKASGELWKSQSVCGGGISWVHDLRRGAKLYHTPGAAKAQRTKLSKHTDYELEVVEFMLFERSEE